MLKTISELKPHDHIAFHTMFVADGYLPKGTRPGTYYVSVKKVITQGSLMTESVARLMFFNGWISQWLPVGYQFEIVDTTLDNLVPTTYKRGVTVGGKNIE